MVLFLIFILLSMSTPSYADDFDYNGDSLHSYFHHTITFTVGQISNLSEKGWEILFDSSLLEGEHTEALDFFSMYNITDTNIPDAEHRRRIPMLLDRVSGPPGTVIDVTYFYYNLTGHDIELSNILVPYSKEDISEGNLLNLCSFEYVPPVWERVSVQVGIKERKRDSFFSRYTGLGIFQNGEEGKMLVEKMEIMDPLELSAVEYEVVGEEYRFNVGISNITGEQLDDIEFRHGSLLTVFTLYPYEELDLNYSIHMEEVGAKIEVVNNNWKTECSNVGGILNNWADAKAITVFADRAGRIDAGAYFQPNGEGFCITRVPYSLVYNLPNDYEVFIPLNEGLSEETNQETQESVVLGVEDVVEDLKVLPFTAMW